MSDRPQYEHDARKGETRYDRDQRDPHSSLNTPLSELERQAAEDGAPRGSQGVDVQGMGGGSKGGGEGDDPELRPGSRGDREERNPGQMTPRGIADAEAEAMRRAQDVTGVPLVDDD